MDFIESSTQSLEFAHATRGGESSGNGGAAGTPTRGKRPRGAGLGSWGFARTQPTSPASLNFDGLYRKITQYYQYYQRGYLISAPRAIE